MNKAPRLVMATVTALLPLLARAEGKCDDDPVPYGPGNKLVVTWSIPHPQGALVRQTGEDVFNQVDQQLGLSSFHPSYPAKYRNPKLVDIYNEAELLTADDLKAWQKRFGNTVPPESYAAFDEYVKGGHHIRGVLVEHPMVSPAGYALCSCVLQRGVVIYNPSGKQEDLFVRSHFSSVKDAKTFENFAPREGFWFSFRRDKIWFPLRLNKLLKEQAWMVLDILTPKGKPLPAGAIKPPYTEAKRGPVKLLGQDYEAVRVLGTFQPGQAVADLEIPSP